MDVKGTRFASIHAGSRPMFPLFPLFPLFLEQGWKQSAF